MYEFTKIERISASKKATNERLDNFNEIYEVFGDDESTSQASRCIQCGNPYCSSLGCPLGNNIPQWLKFIAEKDLNLAFDISNETSPYPEILGRICPHNSLCEGACTLNDGHGAVTIGSIEVSINEQGFAQGMEPKFAKLIDGKQVAIIGSGPAGLSAATFLLRAGIRPIVYEKQDSPGGLLTYGIPGFKLEKQTVERRINMLTNAGMILKCNTEIGKDVSFESLQKEHDAVFIGVGAMEGRVLNYEGYNEDQIFMAVPFLTNIQKKIDGKDYSSKYKVKDKRVIVIGGGDTAMDCVRTSIREGAAEVSCFYRRDEEAMPGSYKEVECAKEEGVHFQFMKSPKGFITDKDGKIVGVNFIETTLGEPDASGRSKLSEVEGSEAEYGCDIIILALGFQNEKLNFLKENNIELEAWGAIKVDERGMTSVDKVYAGGDGVRGADLVVTAALDGRECAKHIIEDILEQVEA